MSTRRWKSGQALIETAVTIPLMILMFIGFLALGVLIQGLIDLNTAVYLSAASAVTSPAVTQPPYTSAVGLQYAKDTFNGTLRHMSNLSSTGVSCTGSWNPPAKVTCQASAQLLLRNTPFGVIMPVDPTISASASAQGSPYRST